MKHTSLILVFFAGLLLASCGSPVPFSNTQAPVISNPIVIEQTSSWGGEVQRFVIRPDGSGYFFGFMSPQSTQVESWRFNAGIANFKMAANLLRPLQSFAGDDEILKFGLPAEITKTLKPSFPCKRQVEDSDTFVIYWQSGLIEQINNQKDLNRRDFFLLYSGCRSNEANAAKDRISKVIDIVEKSAKGGLKI
jgi:hypothetical protein